MKACILAILLALLIEPTDGFAAEPIRILYDERPPYMSEDGMGGVRGLTADVIIHAMKRAGVPYQWVLIPSPRQLLMVRNDGGRVAALGWFRNPERERFAKFSHPVYRDRSIALLTRKDHAGVMRHTTIDSLFRDASQVLLVKTGYSYGPFVDRTIAGLNPKRMSITGGNREMITMIARSRADYMFIAPEESGPAITAAGFTIDGFSLHHLSGMPPGEKRYLLFSQQVDDATIRRINQYIDEYHRQHGIRLD